MLSGHIAENKRIEKEGQYYFVAVWPSGCNLKKFMVTVDYQILNGAFHALGSIQQSITGNLNDIRKISANSYSAN